MVYSPTKLDYYLPLVAFIILTLFGMYFAVTQTARTLALAHHGVSSVALVAHVEKEEWVSKRGRKHVIFHTTVDFEGQARRLEFDNYYEPGTRFGVRHQAGNPGNYILTSPSSPSSSVAFILDRLATEQSRSDGYLFGLLLFFLGPPGTWAYWLFARKKIQELEEKSALDAIHPVEHVPRPATRPRP